MDCSASAVLHGPGHAPVALGQTAEKQLYTAHGGHVHGEEHWAPQPFFAEKIGNRWMETVDGSIDRPTNGSAAELRLYWCMAHAQWLQALCVCGVSNPAKLRDRLTERIGDFCAGGVQALRLSTRSQAMRLAKVNGGRPLSSWAP